MQKEKPSHQVRQMNLFSLRPKIPAWLTLPAEVRRKVVTRLAHLIRDHRIRRGEGKNRKEASDE